MKSKTRSIAFAVLAPIALSGSMASAASTVYSTGFTNFAQGTDFRTNFNITYGGINPGGNFAAVTSGQWGITSNGSFAGNIARPQTSGALNLKMAGLFLDPIVFASTGAGTYTISFNLTGESGGAAAYQAFVYSGSGYDITGAEDKRLNLNLSAGGFGVYTGLTGTGSGVSTSTLATLDLSTEATTSSTQSISFDFTYDGTSAIAFAIGGYRNAATIDNFSVDFVPEPGSLSMLGVALGTLVLRRRR